MIEKSWVIACGVLLAAVLPASAQVIKGVIQVTGGEMD
jgi:hypothetical protein